MKKYPFGKKFTYFKGRTKGFFQTYSKKTKNLFEAAFVTYQKEGLANAAKRSLNYIRYGKGVLKKKETTPKPADEIVQDKDIYCLTGNGIKNTDVLGQIKVFLKDAKEECFLLVSHNSFTSGAPILVSHIAKVLNRNFKKKIIIMTIKGGPIEREFERFGMIINLNQVSLNSLTKIEEIDSIFESLRKHGIEKCICNSVVSGILVPFLKKNNFDYVNLIHEQANSIRSLGFVNVLNDISKYSKKIVFSSEFVRNELIETFNQRLENAVVRPQGLFLKNRLCESKGLARQLLRKKLSLPENSKVVLACGFANMRKGFDLFYDIAKKTTKSESGEDVEFVWLGDRDETLFKKLNDMAIEEGFADKIHLCDFEKDPSVFFAGSDAFLLTSREDPFPSVVLMAMDCGIPVIAFDHSGGIPELLSDGSGVVVPYLDVDAMLRELNRLLHDEKLRESIATKARQIIKNRFKFSEYVKFLLGLFDNKTEINCSAAAGSNKKISVVVPNYNYEKFLGERLYSIVSQTHKPFEIIFLDDVSKDNSVEFAENFLSKTDIPYRIIRNETNAGCFKQWAKGAREASGDLIWIAEADDSCEPEFLEELAAKFEDPKVGLAYAQSVRIDEFGKKEGICFPYVESATGINDRWRKDHTNDGLNEICEYLSEKNIIVNASAVVMRRELLLQLGDGIGGGFKLAGDWFTYIQILRNSKIAFSSLLLNYHRHHCNAIGSRSGKMPEEKARQLVSETIGMHDFILSNFPMSHKRAMLALEHIKLVCRNHLGKELDTFPEFGEKLEIYNKAAKNSQKRILFFSTNEGWGGSEVACVKLAQSFSDAGWRVSLVMNRHVPRPELLSSIVSDGSIEFFERGVRDYCGSEETSEFVNNFDADIIYISQGQVFKSAELMQWCKDNGLKYVNFIPLVSEYHSIAIRDKKIIEENGILLQQSKKIFLDNRSAQDAMRKIFNITFDNFQVIRNGFDVQYRQEFTWNEPKNDEFRLAFIGRLEKIHKGLDMLLEVLSMKKWKNRPLKIMAYGHGPYEEIIKKTLKKNDMTNLILCGYTDNLENAILQVQGVIFPSRMEGTPISLVDSLLCHRMAIVTPVGGMPEMITDGLNGFVAESVSMKGIDECLERAWQKRGKWRELGENAGKKVREMVPEFPHQETIEAVDKILSQKL